MIRVRLTGRDISREKADLAVCFAYEGDREPRGVADPALRDELAAQMKEEGFRGLPADLLVWNTDSRFAPRRFAVQGLGSPDRPQSQALRGGAARVARAAASYSAGSLALRKRREPRWRAPCWGRTGSIATSPTRCESGSVWSRWSSRPTAHGRRCARRRTARGSPHPRSGWRATWSTRLRRSSPRPPLLAGRSPRRAGPG